MIDDQAYGNTNVDEFHGFPARDTTAPNRFRTDAIHELRSYGVAGVSTGVTQVHATVRSITVELADRGSVDAAAMPPY